MDFRLEGLTDFQNDLIDIVEKKLPKERYKIMRKVGSKARTYISKRARTKVQKDSGNYHKMFKRGKVFKDADGQIVVRVINSAPHAHLIEHGHRQVTKNGEEVGFVTGKKVMEEGINSFNNSGEPVEMISDWLDELLDSGGL